MKIRKKWMALLLSIAMIMTDSVIASAAETTDAVIVEEAAFGGGDYFEEQSASENISLVTKNGYFRDGMTLFIGAGNKIKFDIGDGNGVKVKGARKRAEWTVSNPSYFSVKKGTLKCGKKAATYTGISWNSLASTTMYTNYDGTSISLNFIAVPKAKNVGYIQANKFKTKKTIVGKVGSTFDLRNVNGMVGDKAKVFVSYATKKSGTIKYYYSYADLEKTNPYITVSKKAKNSGTVSADATGSIYSFTPTSAGKYKITYTMRDGSNKKFYITLKAE